jgi:hypothetical protein
MTITQSESGLGPVEYAGIQTAHGDLSAEILLQRYGPTYSSHDTDGTRDGDAFDAIAISGYLLRAYSGTSSDVVIERLADETGGAEAWVALNNSITDMNELVSPRLIGSGATARLFYYSSDGKIRYIECADITAGGASFGASQNVGAVADVKHLAPVSTTKLYYATLNSNFNRVFHIYEDDGGWATTASDVYWPYAIRSLDVVSLTGFDLLAFASSLSPLMGSRVVGTVVTTECTEVQGIVTMKVANGRWSDYGLVDVIDRIETNNAARETLRLSYINSIIFASYMRRGGSDAHTYSKLSVIRSKDGDNWESPWLIDDTDAPAVVIPRTDYLYVVGISETLRSPCCAWAGQTPVELDVTERVIAVESSAADIRNTTTLLANPAEVLASTLAESDDWVQVVHKLGYVAGGGQSDLKVQVSMEDVVSRDKVWMLPAKHIRLASRDRLGRVNRVRADQANEWPSMQSGADDYNDPSGTGYGGLRHTAPLDGSWKAEDGVCKLLSSNMQGIAVSTLVTDALNGSAQTGIKLATASQGEYAGIAFRVYDKDNMHYVMYDLDNDVIKLYSRESGVDTLLDTSDAIGWGSIDTWYYLKVTVRYSLVYVYYSADGITWSAVLWSASATPRELTGQRADPGAGSTVLAGRFGLIGYAYSDVDEYNWDFPDPWIAPIPSPPVLPTPDIVFVTDDDDEIYRTENWGATSPNWVNITGALNNINRILIGQTKRHIFALCDSGLYRATVDSAAPAWTKLLAIPPVNPNMDYMFHKALAITINGYVAMVGRAYDQCACALTNRDMPVMVIVSPDGAISYLPRDGVWGGSCCGIHGTSNMWSNPGATVNVVDTWSLCSNISQQFIMSMMCAQGTGMSYKYNHLGIADQAASGYSYVAKWSSTPGITGLAALGTSLIGKTGATLSSFSSENDSAYSDITPANYQYSSFRGLDSDALLPTVVVASDVDRVYISDGGVFAEALYRDDLAGGIGRFQHCSCYAEDPDMMFLACNGDDGTRSIFWTRDSWETVIDKTGDFPGGTDPIEIRPVWSKVV